MQDQSVVCKTCNGTGWEGHTADSDKLHEPECERCRTCGGTGRIPAQGAEMRIHGSSLRFEQESPAEAEQGAVEPSIPPTPAGEGELDLLRSLLELVELSFDNERWGDRDESTIRFTTTRRFTDVDKALAAINAYIARRVLEVIGEDEDYSPSGVFGPDPDEQAARVRNQLRKEQRQRIAVIKKESQQ